MQLLTPFEEQVFDPETQKIVDLIKNSVGEVAKPLQLMTTSPRLFKHYMGGIGFYRDHESLSFELLTFLRYLVASKLDLKGCVDFNGNVLKKQGLTNTELQEIARDQSNLPLSENERELIQFVLKGLDEGKTATKKEMDKLLELGWQESDIVDAVNHGFSMIGPGKMLEYFSY